MKILSICLAAVLLGLTVMNLYEGYVIPEQLTSPFVPPSIIKSIQKPYIIHAVINFIFFLPLIYILIRKPLLVTPKIIGSIFLLYIVVFLVMNFYAYQWLK